MAQKKSEKPKKVKISRKQQEFYANLQRRNDNRKGKK